MRTEIMICSYERNGTEKEVYCRQSTTFKRSMKDIQNIMNGKPFSIIKISGKTKAGRDYINCTLDINSL